MRKIVEFYIAHEESLVDAGVQTATEEKRVTVEMGMQVDSETSTHVDMGMHADDATQSSISNASNDSNGRGFTIPIGDGGLLTPAATPQAERVRDYYANAAQDERDEEDNGRADHAATTGNERLPSLMSVLSTSRSGPADMHGPSSNAMPGGLEDVDHDVQMVDAVRFISSLHDII